jgi:hypothetical protein
VSATLAGKEAKVNVGGKMGSGWDLILFQNCAAPPKTPFSRAREGHEFHWCRYIAEKQKRFNRLRESLPS